MEQLHGLLTNRNYFFTNKKYKKLKHSLPFLEVNKIVQVKIIEKIVN